MIYMYVLICTVILAVLWLWRKEIKDYWVFPLMVISFFLVGSMVMYISAKSQLGDDTMVLNGEVVSKKKERTSCRHSYQVCVPVSNGKSTSMSCTTHYEHAYDYDWVVHSTIGSTTIDTVDRRGEQEPPRFTSVQIGEPFSLEKSYFNYIRASPMSVFKDWNAYKDVPIPEHPKVYDYYRVSHVIDHNSEWKSGIKSIDNALSWRLAKSSAKAKANVLVVFYGGSDSFTEAMKVKTLGGRINDLTVMIRANKDGIIQNVAVYSWSKSDLVNVKLRDEVLDLYELNSSTQKKLVDILDETLVKYYQHRSIEEFKYLESNIQMPTWYYVLMFIWAVIAIAANVFLLKK